jgi:hypothetical protein
MADDRGELDVWLRANDPIGRGGPAQLADDELLDEVRRRIRIDPACDRDRAPAAAEPAAPRSR